MHIHNTCENKVNFSFILKTDKREGLSWYMRESRQRSEVRGQIMAQREGDDPFEAEHTC